MWEIFRTTGDIRAYLVYRECQSRSTLNPETSRD
ncbi:YqzL family protein [Thermosinus carboxydivorans]